MNRTLSILFLLFVLVGCSQAATTNLPTGIGKPSAIITTTTIVPPINAPTAGIQPPGSPTPPAVKTLSPTQAQPGRQVMPSASYEGMMLIPAGEFEMGDHQGFVDPQHPSDEVPIHAVHIDSFYMSAAEATNQQYSDYLNSALGQGLIEVRNAIVYGKGDDQIYFTTRQADPYSRIGWDGHTFTVLDGRGNHPVTSVRWFGAAAYTNWLSSKYGLEPCFDLTSGICDFSKKGFRLPTEAEWEYAARGSLYSPYGIFPWGDEADKARANWPDSGDPYEVGANPWTTPVKFYNGELHRKADFNWPGVQETYQPHNGVNGFGLYDMAGNVWEYVYDWYGRDYYKTSPRDNPRGPDVGSPMPDGKPYRGMRGGSWYNGENGHSRVANRNPSYYRGPQDPDHPYYHLGFRVALDLKDEIR